MPDRRRGTGLACAASPEVFADLSEPGSAFAFTDPPSWHTVAPRVGCADLQGTARPLPPRRVVAPPPSRWTRFLLWSGLSCDQPSNAQLRNRRLVATLTRPLEVSRTIAVVSAKGGVGTTSTVVNLGHVFAGFRNDRVIALDANPSAGNLAYRIPCGTGATVADLLADPEDDPDTHLYTRRAPSRLEILASPPGASTVGLERYERVLEVLASHYKLILADCATAVLDTACSTVAAAADQLVVVSHPTIDATRAVSHLLAWFGAHGHGRLVNEAVLVLNAVGTRSGPVDLTKIEQHFAAQVRQVVSVPWDPHLQAGARTRLEDLQPCTRHAYLRLAAAVTDGWDENS